MLRELGWICIQGRQDRPRISEATLRSEEELYSLRKELIFLMKDAKHFIRFVFKSDNSDDWVDRCTSIIKAK